jgi:hypothetical protein
MRLRSLPGVTDNLNPLKTVIHVGFTKMNNMAERICGANA